MKVALIAWMLDIEKHAGVGRVGAEIYNGLTKRGHEVILKSLNSTSHLDYLKYLTWDIPRNLPEADVYIAQSPMESIFLPKNKTIAIVHDLIPLLHPEVAGAHMNGNRIKTFLGSRFYWFGARVASRCKRVVCNSSQTRDELQQYFKIPDERLRVVSLGVRPDLEPRPKPDNVFRVGYLGQLDRRKRVNLLIEAFKGLDIKGELVIAGSGPDKAKLQALAGDDSRIKFLGFVPDSKLCDFYNSLDLFAFPSAAEGWGIPVVEAMACGREVLLSGDAFIPAELKNRTWGSLATRWDNTSAVIEAYGVMLQLLYEQRDKFGSPHAGDKDENYHFAKSLTWDGFVDGLEIIIKEVVGA